MATKKEARRAALKAMIERRAEKKESPAHEKAEKE